MLRLSTDEIINRTRLLDSEIKVRRKWLKSLGETVTYLRNIIIRL